MNDIIERLAPDLVHPDPKWTAQTLGRIRSSGAPRRRWPRLLFTGAAIGIALGGGAAVANVGPFQPSNQLEKGIQEQRLEKMGRVQGGGENSMGRGGPIESSPFAELDAITEEPWATNEFGLTVGEPTRGDVEAQNLPDLIPTFVLEGQEPIIGYFRSDELYIFGPDGELQNRSDESTVYGPDGRAVLGTR